MDVDESTDAAVLRAQSPPLMQADPWVPADPVLAVAVTVFKTSNTTVAFRAHTMPDQDGAAFNRLIKRLYPVIYPPQKPAAASGPDRPRSLWGTSDTGALSS